MPADEQGGRPAHMSSSSAVAGGRGVQQLNLLTLMTDLCNALYSPSADLEKSSESHRVVTSDGHAFPVVGISSCRSSDADSMSTTHRTRDRGSTDTGSVAEPAWSRSVAAVDVSHGDGHEYHDGAGHVVLVSVDEYGNPHFDRIAPHLPESQGSQESGAPHPSSTSTPTIASSHTATTAATASSSAHSQEYDATLALASVLTGASAWTDGQSHGAGAGVAGGQAGQAAEGLGGRFESSMRQPSADPRKQLLDEVNFYALENLLQTGVYGGNGLESCRSAVGRVRSFLATTMQLMWQQWLTALRVRGTEMNICGLRGLHGTGKPAGVLTSSCSTAAITWCNRV